MEKVRERTGIYHEHQEGSLCAQHALNSLLQSQMFLADSLADIARELDFEETSVLEQTSFESENMDDTGFFNIQVLQRALKIFEIELVPYESQDDIAKQARDDPENIQAYICHLGLHWFTIRRFGRQYFNLNSMYFVPELLPQGILPRFLTMIQDAGKATGCSVFIVHGSLPPCVADQQLTANPVSDYEYISLTRDLPKFCIDEKLLTNVRKLDKNGNPVIKVPKQIYDKYQKNPNDPKMQQMILEYTSKEFPDDEYLEPVDYNNLGAGANRPLLVALVPRYAKGQQLITRCNCPLHREQARLLAQSGSQPTMNGAFYETSSASQRDGLMITEQVTQYTFDEPNPTDPYARPQRRMLTSYVVSTDRSGNRNGKLVGDSQLPLMNQTRMSITNEENSLIPNMMESSFLRRDAPVANSNIRRQTHRNLGLRTEEEKLMQLAFTRKLLRESVDPLSDDLDDRSLQEHVNEFDQEQLDLAIAASLAMSKSSEIQPTEASEVVPSITENSSSTPQINSELLETENPSLTPTSSASTTQTDSSPPTENQSSVVTDIFPTPLVNTYSPPTSMNNGSQPQTTTHSPPTPNKSDSFLPDPEDIRSLTIEELRQRRLRIYGNRDRSIISQQSNYSD